jgi:putative ABC transport system permease protein
MTIIPWRDSSLRSYVFALVLAVWSVGTILFFSDRIESYLNHHARDLLAADLVVKSEDAIPNDWVQRARHLGLNTALTVEFQSMARLFEHDRPTLSTIKAVSEHYPLRGQLIYAHTTYPIPQPGEVWLDRANTLSKKVEIGSAEFDVQGQIIREPDTSFGLIAALPKVLMRLEDIDKTELLGPGSRVTWRLMLTGSPQQLEAFQSWLKPGLLPGASFQNPEDGQSTIQKSFDHTRILLGVSILSCFTLAMVAMILVTRRLHQEHEQSIAIFRVLGVSRRRMFYSLFGQIAFLSLLSGVIGSCLAYGTEQLMIKAFLDVSILPSNRLAPWLFLCLFACGLGLSFFGAPIWAMVSVSPLKIWRSSVSFGQVWKSFSLALLSAIFWWLLLSFLIDQLILGLVALAIILVFFFICFLSVVVINYGYKNPGDRFALVWCFIKEHPWLSAVQCFSVSLGLSMLVLLFALRADVLDRWVNSIPEDAPNYFLINIQQDQRNIVLKELTNQFGVKPRMDPVLRGRIDPAYVKQTKSRFIDREFTLSYFSELPLKNHIAQGSWWSSSEEDGWSLDVDVAKELGLGVGDTIAFWVAGQKYEAPIKNLRKVEWSQLTANYYAIASPHLFKNQPVSWMTTFRVKPDKAQALQEWQKLYPSLMLLDLNLVVNEARSFIEKISQVLIGLLSLSVIAGILVLYLVGQMTRDQQQSDQKVLSTLGVAHAKIKILRYFSCMVWSLWSGLFAAMCAYVAVFLVQQKIFNQIFISWQPLCLSFILASLFFAVFYLRSVRR